MVTDRFAHWALGFSGCDGGDPERSVWICGIEWGGGHTPNDLNLDEDVSEPKYVGLGGGWEDWEWKKFRKLPYNWRALKLICALEGRDVATYREFYDARKCFDAGSGYFKLNLYPLGFRNVSPQRWQDWLSDQTGFPTKKGYQDWCRLNRFPVIRGWATRYLPSIIICTGKDYRDDFLRAFAGAGAVAAQVDAGGKKIWYTAANDGHTLVVVTYFLGGKFGLNRNFELQATGTRIAELKNSLTAITGR